MERSSGSILIVVAVIGLLGTTGAALIASWDKIFPHAPPIVGEAAPPSTSSAPGTVASPGAPAKGLVAPHAPTIQVNPQTTVWGEDTRLIALAPGGSATINGNDLYAVVATYPVSSCVGPAFIIYTWQVRDPYPEGGDLEIRRALQGGSTDQVALGAMGRATMGPCEEHTFKNNGLQPMRVEVRYATAVEATR